MRRTVGLSGLALALGLSIFGTLTHAQTISIGDVRLLEGDGGPTAFNFDVTLSVPGGSTVSASWATADGTAIGPGDYAPVVGGSVVFPPGNTLQTVSVDVNGDTTVEADEFFYVDLSSVSGATLLKSRGIGAILDDDTVRPGVQAFSIVSDGVAGNGRNRLQWFVPAGATGATGVVVRYNEGPSCASPTMPTGGANLSVAGPVVPDETHVEPHELLTLDRQYCYSIWLEYGGMYSARSELSARPFDSTGSVKWKYYTGMTAMAPPTVGVDAVIVPSNDKHIHAMRRDPASPDAGTWPAMPWRPALLESPVQHRVPVIPLPGGGRAFVSTANGWVHAVDTASGDLLWSTPLPEGAALGAPAGIFTAFSGAYDYVLVGTSVGGSFNQLYAFDPFTGVTIDSYPKSTDPYYGQMGPILGMPSVDYTNLRVYFASRAWGPTIWSLDLGPSSDALKPGWTPKSTPDIDGSVVLHNGRVYAGTANSPFAEIHSVSAADGTSYLYFTGGAVQGFLFPDRRSNDLYAATHNPDQVWAITDTGSSMNTNKWAVEPTLTTPSIVLHHPGTDDVYVGVQDYSGLGAAVVKIDAVSGAVAPGPGPGFVVLESTPQAIGAPSLDLVYGMLYVGSEAGVIYAVALGF
jgi:outer membrane protein assembly factor BamB